MYVGVSVVIFLPFQNGKTPSKSCIDYNYTSTITWNVSSDPNWTCFFVRGHKSKTVNTCGKILIQKVTIIVLR